jgi:hypothetical protein
LGTGPAIPPVVPPSAAVCDQRRYNEAFGVQNQNAASQPIERFGRKAFLACRGYGFG